PSSYWCLARKVGFNLSSQAPQCLWCSKRLGRQRACSTHELAESAATLCGERIRGGPPLSIPFGNCSAAWPDKPTPLVAANQRPTLRAFFMASISALSNSNSSIQTVAVQKKSYQT